jgi:hypothetical protein
VMYPARKMSPANGRIRTARINDHTVARSKGKVHHSGWFWMFSPRRSPEISHPK